MIKPKERRMKRPEGEADMVAKEPGIKPSFRG
jgi:hypothetical protein